jgi:hypothetical protein
MSNINVSDLLLMGNISQNAMLDTHLAQHAYFTHPITAIQISSLTNLSYAVAFLRKWTTIGLLNSLQEAT